VGAAFTFSPPLLSPLFPSRYAPFARSLSPAHLVPRPLRTQSPRHPVNSLARVVSGQLVLLKLPAAWCLLLEPIQDPMTIRNTGKSRKSAMDAVNPEGPCTLCANTSVQFYRERGEGSSAINLNTRVRLLASVAGSGEGRLSETPTSSQREQELAGGTTTAVP